MYQYYHTIYSYMCNCACDWIIMMSQIESQKEQEDSLGMRPAVPELGINIPDKLFLRY